MNFDFDAWWKEMKPAECDEFKPYFEESWQLGFKDGYEKGVAAFHEAVKIEREKCAEDVKTIREATCLWFEGDDGGPWATQCNELFNIENEGPEANGMRFCCFCGKKLVEAEDGTEDENL